MYGLDLLLYTHAINEVVSTHVQPYRLKGWCNHIYRSITCSVIPSNLWCSEITLTVLLWCAVRIPVEISIIYSLHISEYIIEISHHGWCVWSGLVGGTAPQTPDPGACIAAPGLRCLSWQFGDLFWHQRLGLEFRNRLWGVMAPTLWCRSWHVCGHHFWCRTAPTFFTV